MSSIPATPAEAPGSAGRYRPDIDGLRAVAVISVVLFHAGYRRFTGGFVGVDIFFVISGFLITRIIRDQVEHRDFSFKKFYVRRMRRLFPALFATVVLTFITAVVFFAPDLFRAVGSSSIAALLSYSNIHFWQDSGYFDAANTLKPLLHTWSLGVEEQFYLVWPLILVVASRWRAALPVLLGLFAGSIVLGLVYRSEPTAVFYLTPFRIYQLAIGGLMVWVVDRVVVTGFVREAGLALGLALIAVAVLTFTEATPFPVNGLVPCVGAALVILFGSAPRLGLLLRNPVAVGIGLVSYSIYLVHWPIVVFYRYAVNDELGIVERVAMVVLAIAAGFAMNRLVENRYRYVRPGSLRPSRFVAVAAGCALVVTAISLNVQATGWTWRLGDREAAYLDIKDIYGGAACKPPRCEFGSGEPLIVMGDSHARAYFAGMSRLLPDRRLIFYERSGCPFFSVDKTRDYGELVDYDAPCRAARDQGFEEVRQTGADVVVAQNWFVVDMVSLTTPERWEFATNAEWATFAATEVDRLQSELQIENLVVIGNVPTPGGLVSPLDCIARPVRLNDVGCRATPIDNPKLVARRGFNEILRERLDGSAWFVDPFDYLCDSSACANFEESFPLYVDKTHLSTLGSLRVVEGVLASPVRAALAP